MGKHQILEIFHHQVSDIYFSPWNNDNLITFICFFILTKSLYLLDLSYVCISNINITLNYTYNWNVSLYFGLQLLDLDLVECFLFLSFRCGPMRWTSTNGRNIPVVLHLRSLQATTRNTWQHICYYLLHKLMHIRLPMNENEW